MTQAHLSSQDPRSASGRIAKIATIGNLVALISICFLGVVGALVVQDLMSDVITIEPIEVPKTLSENGYTPGVAGSRLRDALNTYAGAPPPGDDGASLNSNLDPVAYDDGGLPSNLDLNIAARNELPDVVVPQIGLSLRTIASTIRSALHKNGHAVSGELTVQASKYALRLRIDGQQVFSTTYEADNPDDLMAKAAPKVMNVIRPSVQATVRYRAQNEEGLRKADEIIAGYDESNINVMWAYLLRGSHALKHGNYNEAEKMFSKARSLNSNSEHPHMQLGVLLLRQAKPEDAIKQFKRVLYINPKSARAHNYMGIALAALANQDNAGRDVTKLNGAIEQYQQAIATAPGYALPYHNLGLALFRSDRIDKAIDSYRSAIEIVPNYLLARWNLAYALQKRRSFDAAETEYRAAIELTTDPKQLAMLHTYLGGVLWDKAGGSGNLEATILEYQRAIAIVRPDCYGWAHNNLGLIWHGQDKINDAIAEFDKATTCDPKDETFRDNLQQALRSQEAGAPTTGRAIR